MSAPKPQPELTVWCGAMPESNGKSNFTAILSRKDARGLDKFEGFTIARSEYPDRVRYEADFVRHLIGDLAEKPCVLDYDDKAHSGYIKPASLARPVARRVYISGPITGMPEENKPAFAAEAARLLALGYQVENPADVVLPVGATWADFMRADIPRLLACTHIRMLDGWTMSKGARLEHHIAISLGLEVLTDDDLQEQK